MLKTSTEESAFRRGTNIAHSKKEYRIQETEDSKDEERIQQVAPCNQTRPMLVMPERFFRSQTNPFGGIQETGDRKRGTGGGRQEKVVRMANGCFKERGNTLFT